MGAVCRRSPRDTPNQTFLSPGSPLRGTGSRPRVPRLCYPRFMRLSIEIDREEDGRWIAETMDLSGVLAYGSTRNVALTAAQALALRVVADKLEHAETSIPLGLAFVVPAA